MILASHGIISSSIGQFVSDADYQAVLDYATTQGYTLPSASQQLLQNQLVVDLKDGGIWSKLDTFGVFATDGNSDFALIDWIRLSQYTAVNSPTFTTNEGFKGDGVAAYVDSGYNYNGNVTQNDLHFGGYAFNDRITNNIIGGVDSGSNDVAIIPLLLSDGNSFGRCNNTGRQNFTHNQIGVHIISRNIGTSVNLISPNGIVSNPLSNSATGVPNANMTSLKWGTLYGDNTVSLVHAGVSVNSELTDFYTAVNSYMDSI
jgi:hypothetical protein